MIVVSLAIVYKVDTFQTTLGRPTACLGDGSRTHSNIVFFFIVHYNDHGLNSFCFGGVGLQRALLGLERVWLVLEHISKGILNFWFLWHYKLSV